MSGDSDDGKGMKRKVGIDERCYRLKQMAMLLMEEMLRGVVKDC